VVLVEDHGLDSFLKVLNATVDVPIDDRERYFVDKTLQKIGKYFPARPQHEARWFEIHGCFFVLTLRHLGAPPSTSTHSLVSQATELSRQYFADSWCELHESDQKALSKRSESNELVWFEPLRLGLLMALLANQLQVTTTLADWTESWMVPERVAIPFDPLLGKFYLVMVSDFRSSPLDGRAEIERSLVKSRKKGPKLLFNAWQAVRAGDQVAFESAFLASLEHFEEMFTPTLVAYEYIALDQSILLAAARHRGCQLPTLTRRQQARLLTHESLDLPAPGSP
jgi:hypothetical protein